MFGTEFGLVRFNGVRNVDWSPPSDTRTCIGNASIEETEFVLARPRGRNHGQVPRSVQQLR